MGLDPFQLALKEPVCGLITKFDHVADPAAINDPAGLDDSSLANPLGGFVHTSFRQSTHPNGLTGLEQCVHKLE